jgi:hypothetical protein
VSSGTQGRDKHENVNEENADDGYRREDVGGRASTERRCGTTKDENDERTRWADAPHPFVSSGTR